MGNYKPISEEESLRRSHSKFSNFKLTSICLLLALSISVLVAAFASIGTTIFSSTVVIIVLVASGLLTALCLFLLSRFKR